MLDPIINTAKEDDRIRGYWGHLMEIADRHGLPLGLNGNAWMVTPVVLRPGSGWCVKLLEPGSVEGDKLPAERAILSLVRERMPVPELLGFGTTRSAPARVYHVYGWVEGRQWKEVVPGMDPEGRLRLLKDAGRYLGRLHRLPVPGDGEIPEIPRGNYRQWRSRNLPILDGNLSFLVRAGELTNPQADRVREMVGVARDRLFQSPTALVHGDFSGQNILADITTPEPRITAILDWGNAGVDPLEADYEMVLLNVLLPEPEGDGSVTPYDSGHFQDMCRAFEGGYREERGIGIDWELMRAHALLQWAKRSVANATKDHPVSRALATSMRIVLSMGM